MNRSEQVDPYIIFTADIKPRPGFSALDESKAIGGPSLIRNYETTGPSDCDTERRHFARNPQTILCQGAALGIDESCTVHHFWPGQGLRFIGFLEANGESEMSVKTRGSIFLSIANAAEGNRGDSVYCKGPNSFTFTKTVGAAEIGKVRFFQDGRCAVAFRREGDERPLNLRIDIH